MEKSQLTLSQIGRPGPAITPPIHSLISKLHPRFTNDGLPAVYTRIRLLAAVPAPLGL